MISQNSPAERRLFDVQVWVLARGPSTWLADLHPYEPCRVAGVVERLLIDPRAGLITAWLSDGTATVPAQWGIWRRTPVLALMPGCAIVLEGVAFVGQDDKLVLGEPAFEKHAFSEAA